jgi:hypothetical protein
MIHDIDPLSAADSVSNRQWMAVLKAPPNRTDGRDARLILKS